MKPSCYLTATGQELALQAMSLTWSTINEGLPWFLKEFGYCRVMFGHVHTTSLQ